MKTRLAMNHKSQFRFLTAFALELGTSEAKVVPAREVIVENRNVLKCHVGCKHYGKTLMCPPHSPSVEDFRKIISEYSQVLLLKLNSRAELSPDVAKLPSKDDKDPTLTEEMREKI